MGIEQSSAVGLSQIGEALRRVGIQEGDIVNVHSRLFTIGLLQDADSVSEIPGVYLKAFQTVLGDRGTLVVPTYTTSFGRIGRPFVFEESPSEMGIFSEYVRKAPGSRRTLHPIQSLTALGAQAQALTQDHPRWNVGYDTIWDRMLQRGAKVVTIGISPRRCMSFVHHVEYLACVPYLYHKALQGEVVVGGVRIPCDFLIPVRYLQYGIHYDLSRLQRDLEAASVLHRAPLGGDWIYAVSMEAVFEICMRGLRQDSYYLLQREPTFVEGEIPCDGTTAGREGIVPSYFEVFG